MTMPGSARRVWSREELKVIDRHARELGRGHHTNSRDAAKACLPALKCIWKSRQPRARRTLCGVRQELLVRARSLGLAWSRHSWTVEETRFVEPYVQACVRGDYPSPRAAALACYGVLPTRIRARRATHSVYQLILKLARRRGLKCVKQLPDEREAKVLDRYVRALHEGRYKYVPEAAPDCLAELEPLRRRRPDAGLLLPRTLSWVTLMLYRRSAALGLPRFRNLLTPVEHRLVERYARKVDRGELPDWLVAARECHAEIQRRYAHPSRLRPGGPRRLTSHSIYTIHDQIRGAAQRLKLRGPHCVRWSAQEMKLLRDWLRWYSRYRHVRRLRPMKQASEGLQEDLAKLGSYRAVSACQGQLRKHANLQQGAA
jgi:hypothetical protein